jgi:putative restriction endonuclease
MKRRNWTRDELIVAFNLYCKMRFGQYHRGNPEIIRLASLLGRTPSAVAMKLCNFAAFDPTHQKRGVSGLGNTSQADKKTWEEFNRNWNELAAESERAYRTLRGEEILKPDPETPAVLPLDEPVFAGTKTATERLMKVRLGQAFFRSTILASYNGRCCICDLPLPSLLVASHIVPWASRPDLRVNPRNGLCLCTLHDKAFDCGLISLDTELRVLLSPQLKEHLMHSIVERMFVAFRACAIQLPEKFSPGAEHLEYHRTEVFLSD